MVLVSIYCSFLNFHLFFCSHFFVLIQVFIKIDLIINHILLLKIKVFCFHNILSDPSIDLTLTREPSPV